jgi:hypothetical protein
MFSTILNYINDLILLSGFFLIQHNNIILNLIGYVIIGIISYIEIKKHQVRNKKYYYINIIYNSSKKNYTIYNNIMESINNKEYYRIDIMKTYNDFLIKTNNIDYDIDKQNNCLDLFCILAALDYIFYSNKKITNCFIENGQDILDLYARLINMFYNISIIIKDHDFEDILLKKNLDELYSKYNYNNYIKLKITNFCHKNRMKNLVYE